jgi:hypothetical protein
MENEVFVTHSGLDRKAALPIVEAIRWAGFSVSFPEPIEPGDSLSPSYFPNLLNKIEAAKCLDVGPSRL